MSIEFKTPPPSKTGIEPGAKHRDIAAALKARPNEWALILPDRSASTVQAITSGRNAAFQPPGSFEAVSRSRKNGRADIYARYVGEVSA